MIWTEARIAVLKRMAAAEATFGEVAVALGQDCTRNMVAGKAHRLGIKFSPSPAKLSRASRGVWASLTMAQREAWCAAAQAGREAAAGRRATAS